MNTIAAKKYTKALVSALKDSEIKEAVDLLGRIAKGFEDAQFYGVIDSPFVLKSKRLELVLGIFGLDSVKDKKLVNFLKLLNEKNRLCEIPSIYDELNRYIRAKNNEYELIVQSNFALDSKDLESIKQKLEQRLKVKLYVSQKKSNIEGIKLFVDGMGVESAFLKQSLTNGIKSHILKAFN